MHASNSTLTRHLAEERRQRELLHRVLDRLQHHADAWQHRDPETKE